MQVTTTGSISGQMNYQILGEGADQGEFRDTLASSGDGTGEFRRSEQLLDAEALYDDGSCSFDSLGCTDESACNFDASASIDDGSWTMVHARCLTNVAFAEATAFWKEEMAADCDGPTTNSTHLVCVWRFLYCRRTYDADGIWTT